MMLEPATDTHAGQALGDELQLAVVVADMVHTHHGAVFGQAGGIEMAGVGDRLVDVEQGQGLVLGLADQLQGFRPVLFVDDHRQHLRREEGAVVDRNHIEFVRQVLAGQHQAVAGLLRSDFDIVRVVHAAPVH